MINETFLQKVVYISPYNSYYIGVQMNQGTSVNVYGKLPESVQKRDLLLLLKSLL